MPPIKLPGLSAIMTERNDINEENRQHLAPIQSFYLNSNDLLPVNISTSPFLLFSPPTKNEIVKHASRESLFLCRQIMDTKSKSLCSRAFRRSYDLSRHQKVHLKNRPLYSCQFCHKKFTRLDALKRHERVQGHPTTQ